MSDPLTLERLVRVEVMQEQSNATLSRIERSLEKIEGRLAKAEVTIETAKVGWKTLVTIGGVLMTVAGTVGALLAKWLPFLSAAPR